MLFEIKKLLGENIYDVKIGEINEFRTTVRDALSLRPSILNYKVSFGWAFQPAFCFCESQKPTKGVKSHHCFRSKAAFALVQNSKHVSPCFQLLWG
jgi:hypothetical protein